MKLDSKRSADQAGRSDQKMDIVRFPPITGQRKPRSHRKRPKQDEKKKNEKDNQTVHIAKVERIRCQRKQPFRITELQLDSRIVENLRNQISLRLNRRLSTSSDDVARSTGHVSASEDLYQYLKMLKSKDDTLYSIYNDLGLRHSSQFAITGSGSRAQRIASLTSRMPPISSEFAPPFYLSLPGLPEESDEAGFESVLESSRSGGAGRARIRLAASNDERRPRDPMDKAEHLKFDVGPPASKTGYDVEEKVELNTSEVGLQRKVFEGDFSLAHRHRSLTIGFYIHSTPETEYERTAFMERVYPRLREEGNRRGINLEIFDPWWGMRESVLEEQSEQQLLKTTIKRYHDNAKLFGRHPYFVTMLTLKNATSPAMPTEIPRQEFDAITEAMFEELARLRTSVISEGKTSRASSLSRASRKLQELDETEELETSEEPLAIHAPETSERGQSDPELGKPEAAKSLLSVEAFKEQIQTILRWYRIDENELPAVYRLQTPSVLFPDVLSRNSRIRSQARKSWSFVSRSLLQLLQEVASKTLMDNQGALQKYFTSTCEIELDYFLDLLRAEETSFEPCLWFRPEFKDPSNSNPISENDSDDLEASSEPVSGDHDPSYRPSEDPLARKLENSLSKMIVKTYAVPIGEDGTAAKATRTQLPAYLDHLSNYFTEAVRDVINGAAEAFPADELSRVEREIAAHLSGCKNRTQTFVGRTTELTMIKSYIQGSSHHPLVVWGKTGSGMTSLLSAAAVEAKNWIKKSSSTVVRLVGETVESQTALSLLRSLCLQLSYLQSLNRDMAPDHMYPVPREWNALFNDFKSRLESLSQQHTILLFIDSLHELQASNERERIVWIPSSLPPNVRIVVSTSAYEDPNGCMRFLKSWIPDDETDSNFLQIGEFRRSDVAKVTHDWLSSRSNRSVTDAQHRVIEEAFDACTSPLYVPLVLEEASRWNSCMSDDGIRLASTTRGLVLTLLGRVEREYGDLLVRRALGYLALSRYGLTQNELDDVLCLDDLVSEEVHGLQRPSLRRLPPLMLARFLTDVGVLVKECHSDGYPMKKFAHVLFREVVEERYFKDAKARRTYHVVMADYFSNQGSSCGKGDGKVLAKPIITAQPLYWDAAEDTEAEEESSAKHPRRLYNWRRLEEMPYHLIFSQQVDKLKELCLCNLDYLLARIEHCPLGLRKLINDLEIAVNAEQDDCELKLLSSTLRFSAPVLEEDARQMAPQLAGRLLQILASDKPVTEKDPDKYPNIKRMLRRARDSSTYSSLIALIPSTTCLVPPSGASYRLLSAHRGPITALATSADGTRAATTATDDTMKLWDLVTGMVLRTVRGVGRDVHEIRLASLDRVAVTSELRLIRIWDLQTAECLQTLREFEDPAALAIACGGTLLVAVFQGSNYLRAWSLEGQFELVSETVIQQTGKPMHKDCTTLLSKTCAGAMILYAIRDSCLATAYDLKEGKVVRKMRIHDNGSITAVAISRAYFICGARYPETKLLDRVCLEVFDLETGKHIRSVRSCGWDVIQELSINAIGSHAIAFCSNKNSGTSYVATWNIETEDHKHVAKHGGSPVRGAAGDLRFVLTATGDCSQVRVWNVKESVETKAPKERPRSGVTRILTMRDHPQYVVAQSTDGRKVDVWNAAMNDFCGSVVHSQPELTSGSDDALLLQNALVVVLSNKEYAKVDEGEDDVLVYRTMKAYDLRNDRWISKADGVTIPVFPVENYVLLSEDQLLGPSDTRTQFLIWDVATGSVLFRIRIPFREKEPTADLDETPILGPGGRSASSACMTPWARRSETRTARGRRHRAETEKLRRRRQEIQSERNNCIDRFLISADRSTIVASFYGHHLCVFDVESLKQVRVLRSASFMMHLTVADITCDGSHLVIVTYDDDEKNGLVNLWGLESGSVTHQLSHDGWINTIALSDDARRIAFCSQTKSPTDPNRLCIWKPGSQPPNCREIPGYSRFNTGVTAHLRLTRDSARAVVCAGDISIWDLESSELLCVFSPDSRIQCFEVALNGQLVVLGLQDVPSIVTLKMVSSRTQDSIKVPTGVCLFGEDPTEVMETEGELDEDLSELKIRINPALFFQGADDS